MSMGSNGMMAGVASSGISAPRLHPKKRKYDPAEAEEQFATDLSALGQQQKQNSPQEATYNSPPTSSAIQQPMEMTMAEAQQQLSQSLSSTISTSAPTGSSSSVSGHVMVRTSSAIEEPGAGGTMVVMGRRQTEAEEEQRVSRTTPELDLRDWCETRVLAKYKKGESVYVQGVIKVSDVATELVVEFEGPEGGCVRQTYDVINSNRFDIIADASPSISDVSMPCISCQNRNLLIDLFNF